VLFCSPVRVDYTVVGGEFIVKEGKLVGLETGKLIEEHNRLALQLLEG
jgi:hypothetical protein